MATSAGAGAAWVISVILLAASDPDAKQPRPMPCDFTVRCLDNQLVLDYVGPHFRLQARPSNIFAPATHFSVDLSLGFEFDVGRTYVVTSKRDDVQLFSHDTFKAPSTTRKIDLMVTPTWVLRDTYTWYPFSQRPKEKEWGCQEDPVKEPSVAVAAYASQLAYVYLVQGLNDSQWTQWFGEDPQGMQARYDVTRSVSYAVRDRLRALDFELVCDGALCAPDVFAYVYPQDPRHRVFLCEQFGAASVNLTWDSRPGTLIHEMSHFQPGVVDWAYGVLQCATLAITDPDEAVYNGDSYAYFHEQGIHTTGDITGFDTTTGADHTSSASPRAPQALAQAAALAVGLVHAIAHWLSSTE